MMAALGGHPGVVNLDGEASIVATGLAGVRINTDGTIDKNLDSTYSQIDAGTDWVIPNSAAGSLFEVRCTLDSGSLLVDAGTGTWLAMSTNREWGTDSSATITLALRFAGGPIIDTGQYVLAV